MYKDLLGQYNNHGALVFQRLVVLATAGRHLGQAVQLNTRHSHGEQAWEEKKEMKTNPTIQCTMYYITMGSRTRT